MTRWWTLPQVQVLGSEPNCLVRLESVDANAVRMTSKAVLDEPPYVNAALLGSPSVHASRSWPSASFNSDRETVTPRECQYESKVAARDDCQKAPQMAAAGALIPILKPRF